MRSKNHFAIYFFLGFWVLLTTSCNTLLINEPPVNVSTTRVIIASYNIKKGSPFTDGSIGWRDWPISSKLPSNILTNETQVISQVAKIDIIQGQVLTWDLLMPDSTPTTSTN